MEWSTIIDTLEKELGLIGQRGELAKILDLNSRIISDIKSGRSKNPGSNIALLLINKLHVNPQWLETGEYPIFLEKVNDLTCTEASKSQEKVKNLTSSCAISVHHQVNNLTSEWASNAQQKVNNLTSDNQINLPKNAILDGIGGLALESTAPKFAELEEKMDGKISYQNEKLEALQEQINELKAAITKKSGGEKYAEEVHEAEAAYTADTTNETPETPYEESEETVELPLAENLAAGVPTEAFTTGETYAVPVRFLKKRKKYCVAKIKGTSMTEAGIADGSYVLLEINETPVSGEIVLARYSNRTTLKRLRQKADCSWELCYEDGSMATIDLSGHDWAVVGRFVAVV